MIGRRLGHFEILEVLGAGGMGEVYKARDLELSRLVALKLLPAASIADPERKRRFAFEARAASALNHPNIITIYEISSFDGGDFIAMELVEGRTLDQMLRDGPIPLPDVVNYGLQAADALAAAHAGQLVHRDLKPANIMVTPRGLVKVLDFGLAKLTGFGQSDPDGNLKTITAHTQEGAIVGTLAYMSPEQAEGLKVDARSDIFSFGAVLYEMVSGKRPFVGTSTVSTLASILRDEPRPLAGIRPNLPSGLDCVISGCLRKLPEQRYQSMEEVRAQLEQIKAGHGARPASQPFRWPHWKTVAAVAAAATLILAGAYYLRNNKARHSPAPNDFALTRATNDSGLTTEPAISRDGKLLAYASDRAEGNLDIWVRQAAGGDSVRLTHDPSDEREPSFSPDGTRITFRSDRDGGGIFVVPSLGGEVRMVAKDGRRPRFSPDGRWIAYWTEDFTRAGRVFLIPSAGGAPRRIAPAFADAREPVWAPGGNALLLSAAFGGQPHDWWLVSIDANGPAPVQTGAAASFTRAGLDSDAAPGDWWNDRVIFAAGKGDTRNIWSVALAPGSPQIQDAPERVTAGSSLDASPNFSTDGVVAFSSGTGTTDLWALPINANSGTVTGPMQRLPGNGVFGPDDPSLSADGAVCVFATRGPRLMEIRSRNFTTGHESVPVSIADFEKAPEGTPNSIGRPFVSPDGARIAFRRRIGKTYGIGLVSAAGGISEELCRDCGSPNSWLPSGKLLLFETSGKLPRIGVIDAASHQHRVVLESASWSLISAQVSPNGRTIAFCARVGESRSTIFVAPWNDGAPVPESQWTPITEASEYAARPRWSPDSNMLYFALGRNPKIGGRRIDPSTGKPSGPVLHVQRFPLARYQFTRSNIAISPRQMILAVRESLANIWLRAPEGR